MKNKQNIKNYEKKNNKFDLHFIETKIKLVKNDNLHLKNIKKYSNIIIYGKSNWLTLCRKFVKIHTQ